MQFSICSNSFRVKHFVDFFVEHHVELYQDELDLQLGGWKLRIDEPADNFLFVSCRLRALTEVSFAELRELKQRLPGIWRSGTRREIEPLYQ